MNETREHRAHPPAAADRVVRAEREWCGLPAPRPADVEHGAQVPWLLTLLPLGALLAAVLLALFLSRLVPILPGDADSVDPPGLGTPVRDAAGSAAARAARSGLRRAGSD